MAMVMEWVEQPTSAGCDVAWEMRSSVDVMNDLRTAK